MAVRLVAAPFEQSAELAGFGGGRVDIGAIVSFLGLCRGQDDGKTLAALTLETYPEMAEAELAAIEAEARARWPLFDVLIVHRHGRIAPGEAIVLVATASAHRQAAFEAAEFLMDFLKTRAPFWKIEETAAGERAWVAAKASDDRAAERW